MTNKSETEMTFIIDKKTGEVKVYCDMKETSGFSHDVKHNSFVKKFMKSTIGKDVKVKKYQKNKQNVQENEEECLNIQNKREISTKN